MKVSQSSPELSSNVVMFFGRRRPSILFLTRHRFGLLTLLGILVCMSPPRGWTQSEFASLQGKVLNDQGQPIEGATLTLKDLSRGGETTFVTDKNGVFYRRTLRASEYELTISKAGFQSFRDRLRFGVGEEKRQDFRLGPASSPAEGAFQRGVDAFKRGDHAGAAQAFEEVVRLSPDSAEGHTNLGLAYLQLSRIEDAIEALEEASRLAPDAFATGVPLAAAYARANQVEKAIGAFENALTKPHEPSDPIAVEARLGLGSLYFATGNVKDAIDTYQKVLEVSPSSAEALLGLGKCLFNSGELERARQYLEDVVSAAPDSSQAKEARRFLEQLKELEKKPF